jgi:hypothetical protein
MQGVEGGDGDESELDEGAVPQPVLGEDEDLYDDFFWEAPPSENESESAERGRQPIILNPTEQNTRGTTREAILLKWHRLLGHINPYFLLRIAPNVKGMEEVSSMKSNTRMPRCDACDKAKSKKNNHDKKLHSNATLK